MGKEQTNRSIHITDYHGYSPRSDYSPKSTFGDNLPKFIYVNGEPQPKPLAKLKIGTLLGRGGYGEVYEVLLQQTPLAIKIPRPPLQVTGSYIENEIQKLEMLKRPGNMHTPQITPLFLYWENKRIPCYITQIFSPIENQFEGFGKNAPIDPLKALQLFYLLAKGVKYITSHHIIHNDIKPENIMFYKGTPIITDYGTARSYSEINEVELERLCGRLHGTPIWLPPELISVEKSNKVSHVFYNLGKVCQKTDIWGLGLILMRCLTGHGLFDSVHIKSYSIPDIFFTTHYEFNSAKILSRYRQWANRQLHRMYDGDNKKKRKYIDIYKIRKIIGHEDCMKKWLEKYKNQEKKNEIVSGKHFMAKLLFKKSNLINRPRTDVEIWDFFASALFDFFDICTAPMPQRIKAYRLVETMEAVFPGLARSNTI